MRKLLLKEAKRRAKKKNVSFEISVNDIDIPEFCPILGILLRPGRGYIRHGSPTLDRIIPELGYVKGNVQVISNRANLLKNNASLQELLAVTAHVQQVKDVLDVVL